MDFLENGNIVNSVNFPRVTLDSREGTVKHCFLLKNDKTADEVKAKMADFYGEDLVEIAGGKRGDFGYFIAQVKADTDKTFTCDCVIRTRVL